MDRPDTHEGFVLPDSMDENFILCRIISGSGEDKKYNRPT